jgi:putative pyrroloquinoline-quinone binding quinoprotein/type IX secretion system substrate protein
MKAALLGVFLFPLLVLQVHAQSNWEMSGKDRARSSWVHEETSFAPPLTQQIIQLPEPWANKGGFKVYYMSYADGVLYLAVGGSGHINELIAYDVSSDLVLWSVAITNSGGGAGNTPAILDDRVFMGGQGLGISLTAVDKNTGQVEWKKPVSTMYGKSAIHDGGRIYLVTDSVYCIDPVTGNSIWALRYNETQESKIVCNDSYAVYYEKGTLKVIDKVTTAPIWSRSGTSYEGLTIDKDNVYVSGDKTVVAYNASNAAIVWTHEIPEAMNISSVPDNSLSRDDKTLLYVLWSNNNGNAIVRALNLSDGSVKWTHALPVYGAMTPTIVNGVAYYVHWSPRTLVGIDMETGATVYESTGEWYQYQPVFGDGKLYVSVENANGMGAAIAVLSSGPVAVEHISKPVTTTLTVYPNPATSTATVSYSLAQAGHSRVDVHDALGRRVATVFDGCKEAGTYSASIDKHLPPGLYTVILRTPHSVTTKRLLALPQ